MFEKSICGFQDAQLSLATGVRKQGRVHHCKEAETKVRPCSNTSRMASTKSLAKFLWLPTHLKGLVDRR